VDDVADLVRAFDGRAAVFARRLDAQRSVEVGEVDRAFPTGSAAKLFVLLAYAQLVADGGVRPDERVLLEAPYRDARGGSGVLRHLAAGLQPTLEDCATLMMIVSDNVATDLLLDAIGGPATVRAVMERLGCGDVAVTSPTVWALPPEQFGMASPRGLAEAWTPLDGAGALADRCRRITWRHQHREGFARHVPFSPDLPDFGMTSALRLWSKSGSYPSVSCEAGLFETDHARWVLAVMADEVRDRRSGSTGAGPTLRAEVSRIVFDAWGGGS
jgi:beta-lactamase class A